MAQVGDPAYAIREGFVEGRFDLNARPDAPVPGWGGMPEVAAAVALAARAVVGPGSVRVRA